MPLDPSERSDWSELDLLTVSEATVRLDEETARVRKQVEELEAAEPVDAEELAAAQRRLGLLGRARDRSLNTTVAIAPGRVRTIVEIAETPGPPD
jgi:hypothetical protein